MTTHILYINTVYAHLNALSINIVRPLMHAINENHGVRYDKEGI